MPTCYFVCETCERVHVLNKGSYTMAMCKACLGLLYQSAKTVQPHGALRGEGAFSHQQGMLCFHVCTNKDCGTRWERLVRQDGYGSPKLHVWKVRSTSSAT